jgi:putative spermidine/putrescine transport system ATP-binding protein
MSEIRLENVTKRFGSVVAVDDVTLHVKEGEFITLLGPSGCGKTTLLRLIAGFEYPDSGYIYFDNRVMNDVPVEKRNFGMVFQSYALFPNMNVEKNIAFGLKIAGFTPEQIHKRVKEVLSLIRLEGFEKRMPRQLSGGQMQRVALGRAIAPNPMILLLDEPLSALDAKIRVHLRTEIKRIQKKLGITTIYVTHDQEEALSISDRVAVMKAGKILQLGTPIEIYNNPKNTFIANFVGTSNLIEVRVKKDRCVTKGGLELYVHDIEDFKENEEAILSIRPEYINIIEKKTNNPLKDKNIIKGYVKEIEYLGSITRVKAVASSEVITIDLKGEQISNIHEENEIFMQLPSERIRLLKFDEKVDVL